MGDNIIFNVLNIVDKRLNRLKGSSTKSKSNLLQTIEQYQKTRDILNNVKRLQSKEPSPDNTEQNINQIEIRLTLASQEQNILVKRLTDHDYTEDTDEVLDNSSTPTSPLFVHSKIPSNSNNNTSLTTTTTTTTTTTSTTTSTTDNMSHLNLSETAPEPINRNNNNNSSGGSGGINSSNTNTNPINIINDNNNNNKNSNLISNNSNVSTMVTITDNSLVSNMSTMNTGSISTAASFISNGDSNISITSFASVASTPATHVSTSPSSNNFKSVLEKYEKLDLHSNNDYNVKLSRSRSNSQNNENSNPATSIATTTTTTATNNNNDGLLSISQRGEQITNLLKKQHYHDHPPQLSPFKKSENNKRPKSMRFVKNEDLVLKPSLQQHDKQDNVNEDDNRKSSSFVLQFEVENINDESRNSSKLDVNNSGGSSSGRLRSKSASSVDLQKPPMIEPLPIVSELDEKVIVVLQEESSNNNIKINHKDISSDEKTSPLSIQDISKSPSEENEKKLTIPSIQIDSNIITEQQQEQQQQPQPTVTSLQPPLWNHTSVSVQPVTQSMNDLMSSSVADAFLLKHTNMMRHESALSISQTMQPFLIQDSISFSSTPTLPSLLLKNHSDSNHKISQRLKLAKQIPIRKASEARIGHARTSSLNASHNGNNQNNNNYPHTPQLNHYNPTLSSPLSGQLNVNNNNNNQGQGEKLALLQSLLKAEELTNNAERKVLDEINKVTRQKSEELYQLVWEVRNLDKAIAHILNNRLQISDLSSWNSMMDDKLGLSSSQQSKQQQQKEDTYNNDSVTIELSTQLKQSLERLVVLMRREPALLADTLLRAGYLGEECDKTFKASHTDLSQAIVFSLFGNCFTATDEKLLLLLIKHILELEFSKYPSEQKRKFGSQEPFAYTLLSTYLKYTFGKPYIISVLKDLIVAIIQDHQMNLENDPQKKAMLAEFGLLDEDEFEQQVDQKTLLQQFSGEFLQRVLALQTGLPYGIRYMCKVMVGLWRKYISSTRPSGWIETGFSTIKEKNDERELIIHLVFENFFIPALIRPDHYGVLTGLTISHKTRHNLIQIAKMVLTFLTNPASIPHWLNESMNLEDRLNEYFNEIALVEEPEVYYHRPIYELELGQNLLVSSTDLFILLELIYQNKPAPNQPITQIEQDAVDMIKKVQPASQLQEGMKFLVINVEPKAKEIASEIKISQAIGQSVRLAKENLVLALCVLNFLCGYSSTTICELLLLQCGRSRSMELNILEAQIEETIRSLWALPEQYKANDFQLLLDLMFEDYNRREKKRSMEKQLKLLYLDQLQRHTSQIVAQKNINIEFLTNQKFRLFRDKIYTRMQTEFVSEFMSRFSINTGNCSCCPSIDDVDSEICDTCSLRSTMISTFLKRAKDAMLKSEWWKDASEDDITIALNTLERNLMTQIYNYTFSISKEDIKFSKELKAKSSSVDHRSLYIPEKYANQSPWELAQQEIRKINLYKSPHDKMKCIIDTWNIIFNYTKPLGESGPDDFLPIMGFVIIKARPENLLSNIQYISLYITSMDPTSEVWFMNLKSSVEVIKEVMSGALNYQGWTRGILQPTTDRMEMMKKEIKKKQKSKKYRASIIKLETSSPSLNPL